MIAANENVELIIPIQQKGLTLLRATCRAFPQKMEVLKDLFVAERRFADFLNSKTSDAVTRKNHLREAIAHHENTIVTIEKIKASAITIVNLDEESKSVAELITDCQLELARIEEPR